MLSPSPNGSNGGRGTGGRFAKGNPGGPGNPYAKRVGELRSAMLKAVTNKEWKAIVKKLVESAKAGKPWAIRELFDRCLGKPQEADLIQRIEELEQQLSGSNTR